MIITSGKRKSAVARCVLKTGTGKVTINGKNHESMHLFDKLRIEEPLRIAKEVLGDLEYDFTITVKGGGEKGQIDASRLALAKAFIEATKSEELRDKYLAYDRNLLVADVRRKEAYKPGDSKARSKRQSSKR
jgi:small subunit ribosomal protein S9